MDTRPFEERLKRLESSNRKLRFSMFALLLTACVLACCAFVQPINEVVRTKRLEVVDPKGNVVAVIRYNEAFEGGLVQVRDRYAHRRAWLYATPQGGGFVSVSTEDTNAAIARVSVHRGNAYVSAASGAKGVIVGAKGDEAYVQVMEGKRERLIKVASDERHSVR